MQYTEQIFQRLSEEPSSICVVLDVPHKDFSLATTLRMERMCGSSFGDFRAELKLGGMSERGASQFSLP